MASFTNKQSLDYKNVNLIAQKGVVKSRKEIPIEGHRIVVSAMTSIIGPSFIKAVAKLPEDLQPTLHIPRDIFKEENLNLCNKEGLDKIIVGLGLVEDIKYEELALKLAYTIVLIDIANGYLPQIPERVKQLKEKGFEVIITGSVHTNFGFNYLGNCGVDIIRSGISSGSVCITSDSTGYTRGTLTEIMELNDAKIDWEKRKLNNNLKNLKILADGGFISPADCVKSFMAGADFIMSGRLFVEANECRMHHIKERSYANLKVFPMNEYFGMASKWGKIAMGNSIPDNFIEGKSEKVNPKYSLEQILTTIWEGIRSGVSYSGFTTLSEAIGKGIFEVKH